VILLRLHEVHLKIDDLAFDLSVNHSEREAMQATVFTPGQADLELTILNAEAQRVDSSDIYAWLRDSGLPVEVSIRLKSFVEATSDVGDRVIAIGKIIFLKIIDFVKANSNMAIGIAIGACIGALSSMVPVLGPLLAPIAASIGMTIGAIAGHRQDNATRGGDLRMNAGPIAIAQDVIEIAIAFFNLLIEIINVTIGRQGTIKA